MSERPPPDERVDPGTAQGEGRIQAILLNEHEKRLWEGLARILEEPIGVCVRLCALSGAEHYLAELGRMDQAAMAGALLRLYAEQHGIEVQEHAPSTREVQLGRRRKERRTGGKHHQ